LSGQPARGGKAPLATIAREKGLAIIHRAQRAIVCRQTNVQDQAHPGHRRRAAPPERGGGKPLPFRHNELPRLCLNALRRADQPMHVRGITAMVLTGKGLDPLDRALADATLKRMGDALLLLKRKGVTRLVGLQGSGVLGGLWWRNSRGRRLDGQQATFPKCTRVQFGQAAPRVGEQKPDGHFLPVGQMGILE